jgi:hypothetical protein
MAWSPARRFNVGRFEVDHPGDYAAFSSNQPLGRHHPSVRTLLKTETPWPVPYKSRIKVSLTALRRDIVNSIYGPTGYFQHLKSDPAARQRFARCLEVYAPP